MKYMVFSITIRNEPLFSQFGKIYAHKCNYPPTPNCTCPNINATSCIKCLGIELDAKLTFENHLMSVSKRVRKLTYVFKDLRDVADKQDMRMVYEALVKSILSYCITTWGGECKAKMIMPERAEDDLKSELIKTETFPYL